MGKHDISSVIYTTNDRFVGAAGGGASVRIRGGARGLSSRGTAAWAGQVRHQRQTQHVRGPCLGVAV